MIGIILFYGTLNGSKMNKYFIPNKLKGPYVLGAHSINMEETIIYKLQYSKIGPSNLFEICPSLAKLGSPSKNFIDKQTTNKQMINKLVTVKMNTEALLIARIDGWGEVGKFCIKFCEK